MGVRKATNSHVGRKARQPSKVPIKLYEHTGKSRANNPPVGLVNGKNDPVAHQKKYKFDPHLQPSLAWVGKEEKGELSVPTVSLHVHESLELRRICLDEGDVCARGN